MNNEKLFAIVDSYKDDIIATLKKWIAVPSVGAPRSADNAPFGANVRKMLDTALEDAAAMGFETHEFDGYAMDVSMGSGEKTMGMLCHLDVVPVGDGWTHDPWGGEIVDGKLYGRGTADDKGAAVLALYAMKAVREAGIELNDGVRLILGCDEESGMSDMAHYSACKKMPDYGFSPDADFPVINIEKGGMSIRLLATSDGEEGAKYPIYELYAGERQNVVPGMAMGVIGVKDEDAFKSEFALIKAETEFDVEYTKLVNGKYMIKTVGKSSHASMPHLGKNAAGMLLIVLAKLQAGGGIKNAVKVLSEKIGLEYDGASLGLACADEESGALTCNLGILRFDGKTLSINLDTRAPMCADFPKLCGNAIMALAGSGIAYSLGGYRDTYYVDKNHKVVRGLIDAYTEATGTQGYAFAIGGGTYSRCMPNTVAFGPNFPGDVDMCHMPDEFMDVDKMMKSARIYALAIAKLAGKE